MRTAIAFGLVAAVMLGGAFVLNEQQSSSRDRSVPQYLLAPIEQRTLRESVTMRGELVESRRSVVRAERGGRVTDVPMRPARRIRPGDHVIEVDGRPQVAVTGAFPFWRQLRMTDRGKDVRQLQKILARDGHYRLEIDGVFGPATRDALRAWQRAHRIRPRDGALRPGDMIVMTLRARVARVRVAVGDRVQAGDEIAELAGDDLAVTIELDPSQRLRVRRGQPATIELTGTSLTLDGRIDDVAGFPVRRNRSGETDGADDAEGEMVYLADVAVERPVSSIAGAPARVEILIDEAVDVAAVPLAAIVSDGSGRAVVQVVEDDGSLRQLPVETGLVDGAYIEVHGLRGVDEVVLGA